MTTFPTTRKAKSVWQAGQGGSSPVPDDAVSDGPSDSLRHMHEESWGRASFDSPVGNESLTGATALQTQSGGNFAHPVLSVAGKNGTSPLKDEVVTECPTITNCIDPN